MNWNNELATIDIRKLTTVGRNIYVTMNYKLRTLKTPKMTTYYQDVEPKTELELPNGLSWHIVYSYDPWPA